MLLQHEPARALARRLAKRKASGNGRLKLLYRAVGIHLHETDLAEGQLASRPFALELDRAAEWAAGTDVRSAERSGKVVGPNPVGVRGLNHAVSSR